MGVPAAPKKSLGSWAPSENSAETGLTGDEDREGKEASGDQQST